MTMEKIIFHCMYSTSSSTNDKGFTSVGRPLSANPVSAKILKLYRREFRCREFRRVLDFDVCSGSTSGFRCASKCFAGVSYRPICVYKTSGPGTGISIPRLCHSREAEPTERPVG